MRSILILLLLAAVLATPAAAAKAPQWGLDMTAGLSRNHEADDNSVFARFLFSTPNLDLALEARQEDYPLPPTCVRYLWRYGGPVPTFDEGTRLRLQASYTYWRTHGPMVAWEKQPNAENRWEVGWKIRVGPLYR